MKLSIVDLAPGDWEGVRRIYAEGISTGDATFETEVPSWRTWDGEHLAAPRLVALSEGRVVGWAALSPVSGRCVYRGVAEVSVYVEEASRGRGVGGHLLERLVEEAEKEGIWTLQAGIFPENQPSIALHQKRGFRTVGVREGLGQLRARWRDVVLLERRAARSERDDETVGEIKTSPTTERRQNTNA